MATRPSDNYEWASSTVTQDINIEGSIYTVDNKQEPFQDQKDYGMAYDPIGVEDRRGWPIQFLNYQLNGVYLWMEHLDERYISGDCFKSIGSDKTTIDAQLGGSWTLLDTVVVGGIGSVQYWVKD